MGFFQRLEDRAELMQGMARVVGAPMPSLRSGNHAEASRYRAALLVCALCSHGRDCRSFLDSHDHAAQAPGYCRNGDWLEVLKTGA